MWSELFQEELSSFGGQPAFLPERPPRAYPTISERARWFAERAGSGDDSASFSRLVGALRRAEETPDVAADRRAVLGLARRLRDPATRAQADVGAVALLVDARGRRSHPAVTSLDRRRSGSAFGPLLIVDELEEAWAIVAVPIDPRNAADLDLSTTSLVRWDLEGRGPTVVEASGFSLNDGILVGRITQPGIYQAVALPRHPWLLAAIETLRVHSPWLRMGPLLNERIPTWREGRGIQEQVCQLILCNAEVNEIGRNGGLVDLGLGIPPDVPTRLGVGRDICDQCWGFGDVEGGFMPPELELDRGRRTACARWESIGPAPGSGFWGIGRVTQLEIHPTNGNILLAATAGGGVWRTDDGGGSWRALMDGEPTLTMGAVAFAPSNPDVIFAASGEDAGIYNPAWPGAGIYRSVDGGASWILTSAVPSTRFSALVVHPADPRTLYAAGNRGLHKSTDGGASWVTNPGFASLFRGQITDIVLAHDDPERIYMGVRDDGVYRSTTGGVPSGGTAGFDRLAGDAQLPSGTNAGWIKLAIGRSGTNGSRFLVAKLGPDGSRIFTTTDGGITWTEQALNVATTDFDEWASVIAVDPNNQQRLYAGASTQLERSDDGGVTWTSINSGIHPDQQDLVFDPTNSTQIFLANDGGIYRSPDAGATWFFVSTGMACSQLYDLDISQRAEEVVSCGAQDNGIFFRNAAGLWSNLDFAWDGTQVGIDPTNPDILYVSSQNGIRNIASGGLSRSLDGGATLNPLGTTGLSGGSPWVTILKLDPSDPIADPAANRVVLLCGTNVLFRSTNGGTSWQQVRDVGGIAFETDDKITALEFAPSDPLQLFLGTASGALYRASNGGSAAEDWIRIDVTGTAPNLLFPNSQIAAIGIDPVDPQKVWVVFAGNGVSASDRPDLVLNPLGISHVFKTLDGGTTWVDASGRFAPLHLPDVPTSAIAVDSLNSNVAYVGTDVGAFRTSDGGITWTAFQDGLPRAPVTELRLHRLSRALFAATMGRGVYRRALE